ncbi:MAG: DUF4038 domain-containing protein, partial [Chloroflexi bacterium]|nr:DUF4038 domain-containing protein [Chloroflexota bacterium]
KHTYRTCCSDEGNADLHDQRGVLVVAPYEGGNPLLRHGPLRVAASRRYLEHMDGTPFFWLGDIWWLGLTKRLSWPEGFQFLAADRAAKGFTVIQLTAGLHCDMPAFDPRGENEAGHPWEAGYSRIRPAFFDMMDLRIQWLVRSGLVPCIVGAWGFHLLWLGVERMKQHWRYLVARYGAYPVVWCVAGSVPMPYYVSQSPQEDMAALSQGWPEVARYLRTVDPYGHPVVMHTLPSRMPLAEGDMADLLDAYMVHTGIGGPQGQGRRVSIVRQMVAQEPTKPVIQGEGGFEGLLGNNEGTQRFAFWALFLSGLGGFTYGANGVWQFNNKGDLFGPAPYGAAMGNTLWPEACQFPGSRQVGIGKRLLERYPWWRLESRPEWVQPHADEQDPLNPYAAGIPGELRLIYLPKPILPPPWGEPVDVEKLEPEVRYRAFLFDPKDGSTHGVGRIEGQTSWRVPMPPVLQDWVLVLERDES